ncbi:hypothetical protein NDU88_005556 [Pleurodeles waltl]|uniref:Uncharacterized protein n=1 Tax=Pleurodeles waltl TaxID=8319 RepID=A0AAV7MYT2_PLEWA|nr:hypothetical protein NDU88_005556 [Pleurodeles waltl]
MQICPWYLLGCPTLCISADPTLASASYGSSITTPCLASSSDLLALALVVPVTFLDDPIVVSPELDGATYDDEVSPSGRRSTSTLTPGVMPLGSAILQSELLSSGAHPPVLPLEGPGFISQPPNSDTIPLHQSDWLFDLASANGLDSLPAFSLLSSPGLASEASSALADMLSLSEVLHLQLPTVQLPSA